MTDLQVPSKGVARPGRSASRAEGRTLFAGVSPEAWDGAQIGRFRRALGLTGVKLPRKTLLSLETAIDDGRFTDVVKGLLVNYYDPLYERSSMEGRSFVLEFTTGPDPVEDARRFAPGVARLIREGTL